MRKLISVAMIVAGLVCLVGARRILSRPLEIPQGFAVERFVSNIDQPTDFVFLPGGGMFVVERGNGEAEEGLSHILLVQDGAVTQTVLTVSTNVAWNSGFLALELDPNFRQNGYFYGWYASGRLSLGGGQGSKMTLSRWTYNFGTGKADPASELILIEVDNWSPEHHGNSIVFDNMGYLYLGVGDLGNKEAVQDLGRFEGKVLRIKPTANGYTVPESNPFVGTEGALPEIFAFGFRNPYAMAVREHDNTIVVGDVGEATWEEVNNLLAGRNYGWPLREGVCPIGEYRPCERTDAYEEPVIAYPHNLDPDSSRGAVTGLAFFEGTSWPNNYRFRLFYSDLTYAFMRHGEPWLSGGDTLRFNNGLEGIVRLRYHDERLYFIDYFGGFISSIYYTGSLNSAPVASVSADVVQGAASLAVGFTATVTDEDDDSFVYEWNFGDGSPAVETTEPAVSHTYTADGTYEAWLIVRDDEGGRSDVATVEITVYSGEFPQIVLENLSGPRERFRAGDEFRFAVERSNNDGLGEEPYRWRIDLLHNTHAHTAVNDLVGESGVFMIPVTEHDNDWNLGYSFRLTMITDSGQEIVVEKGLNPQIRSFQYESSHGNAAISVNDSVSRSPFTLQSVVGIENTLVAAESAVFNQSIYTFQGWSWDGGTANEREIVVSAPNRDITFRAVYERTDSAETIHLPKIGTNFSP